MKKIIFIDIPMKPMEPDTNRLVYKNPGNRSLENGTAVIFPINSVLASTLANDDELTVVFLTKQGGENKGAENEALFRQELDGRNRNIGAKICYETVHSEFTESIDTHERVFRDCLSHLKKNAEIFCDITFGPKSLPIILFCVLNFAEKFFDADIRGIIYGKVDFIDNLPQKPVIYDMTPLYYLNSLTNTMNCNSEQEALAALDSFFAL